MADQGAQLSLAGQVEASHAAHPWFRQLVEDRLALLIREGAPFDAEDLRALTGEPVATSPNIFGAAIGAASRAGRIRQHGFTTARRPQAHGRVLRQWIAA